MAYSKPWKSYEEQLDQLAERGMQITERARALDYLERIGYYRLSGLTRSSIFDSICPNARYRDMATLKPSEPGLPFIRN